MLPNAWDASDVKSEAENSSNSILQNMMLAIVRQLNLLFPCNFPQFYQCQAGSEEMKQVRLACSHPHSSFALFSTLDSRPPSATQVIASRYSLSIFSERQCPRKMAKFI